MKDVRNDKRNTGLDYLIMGVVVVIGLAETAHLAAVIFGWTFSRCVTLFLGLVGIGILFCAGFFLFKICRSKKGGEGHGVIRPFPIHDIGVPERLLFAVFAASAVLQIVFICSGNHVYRQGDMTVETVGSFLVSDGIYRVNPITGSPYTEGIPSRLKILCLPTLYGSICKITGLSPRTVVWRIVPVATLFWCYAAFASLGCCLFPGRQVLPANAVSEGLRLEGATSSGRTLGFAGKHWDGRKLGCYMAAVSLLLWAGTYGYGVDGFDLLYSGYRGVIIRNLVLVPWLFSLCLRRKWICALLCVLAEACMVWTFYGMGVCLFIAVGMALIQLFYRVVSAKEKH